eukprot:GHVU01083131.1.p3 GENE.GHVU01083131.1~~GHVU01083131.1.p3  ORF type:complete len:118 (-),score=27.83 GHVU01083131.1:632-985(-)
MSTATWEAEEEVVVVMEATTPTTIARITEGPTLRHRRRRHGAALVGHRLLTAARPLERRTTSLLEDRVTRRASRNTEANRAPLKAPTMGPEDEAAEAEMVLAVVEAWVEAGGAPAAE